MTIMEERQVPMIGSVILVLVAVLGWVVWAQRGKSDVDFCRDVFARLMQGKPAVASKIDWEHLKALGVDVGRAYTRLPDTTQKANYRKAFIAGAALGFRQAKAMPAAFTNWRVMGSQNGHVMVAADYPAKQKTLVMARATTGKKLVDSIQWKE